jgi:hypothetical protein
MSIPFFFSGIVVSLALTRSPFPIGRVYGADLLGAALGCLGVLLLLNHTDGPSAILWVAAIAAAGASFFWWSTIGNSPDKKPPLDFLLGHRKTIFLVLVTCALFNGLTDYGLQPLVVKGKFEGGNSYIFREWNTFSRIAVYPTENREPQLYGPSPKISRDGLKIKQRYMDIDGDAGTTAYSFTGNLEEVDFLKYDVTNLAYHLPNRKRVAVIGVGGGRDILSASILGFRDITGIEINPIFVKLLTREPKFADFTNLNSMKGVRFVIDEARSWLARTDQTFDIIQMSLIDTWAATGAGAFSLSENGLYTVEAWKIFIDRLTPNGSFTVSRWYNPRNPNETGRLLSLAMATLMDLGVTEPRRHIFLAAQRRVATIIVSRTPFSQSDLRILENTATQYEHEVLVSPTVYPISKKLYKIVTAKGRKELEMYTSNLNFDLTPATDDRPFFFNQMPLSKPRQALSLAKSMVGWDSWKGGVRHGNLVATATLLILFAVSLWMVLVTIIIPLRPGIKDVGRKLVTGGTLYFLLIGIGFMMIEIGLLQRMSVFLGHPIYSLSVLLFTLILSTGVGSLLSDRIPLDCRWKFVTWALITGGYIIALPQWLPSVLLASDSATLLFRAIICIATIAPAGLLMGFGFPTGMRLVSSFDRKPTPWFWGINGAAGVLASIAAVTTSISFGISTTLTIGGICYLLLIPTVLVIIPLREMEPA